MKPRLSAFILPVLWFILIFILLTLPGSDIPKISFLDIIYFDKWVHTGLFAVLVFLFGWPYRKMYLPQHVLFIIIAVLGLAYGIAMEYVQEYFIVGRSFDVTDMMADGFGCLVGYLAFRYFSNKARTKNKPL